MNKPDTELQPVVLITEELSSFLVVHGYNKVMLGSMELCKALFGW